MRGRALASFLTFAVMTSLASGQAFAQMEEGLATKMSGQGYGVAGCGVGSVLFGTQKGHVQIASAFLNNYFFPQTFAITSGTSNCDIPRMGQQAAHFIEFNKEVVRREAVMGQGESIDAIAMLLQCQSADVGVELKSNYQQYLGDDVDSYETVRRLMASQPCSTQG